MNKKLINNINFICKSNFAKSVNHFVIINFLIKAVIILLLLQNTFAKNRLSFFQKNNISTSKAAD